MKVDINNKKGFTLIELLAVIVILALVMGIAIVSIGNVIERARDNTYKDTAVNILRGVKQQLVLADQLEVGRYYFTSGVLSSGGTAPSGSEIELIKNISGDPLMGNIARSGGDSYEIQVTPIGNLGVYKAVNTPPVKCGQDYVSYVMVTKNPTDDKQFDFNICVVAGEDDDIIYAKEDILMNGSPSDVIIDPDTLINNPAIPTITGGATKVYNYQTTRLTCSTTTTYSTGTTIYYEFGYASSAANFNAGTITWLGNPTTTNTYDVPKGYGKSARYYTCRVYATSDTDTTDTLTTTSTTTMSLVNSRINFDATTNGGTISGSATLYVPYGMTNIYTGKTNSTAGTIPTATKSGATFTGWWTAASGGTLVIDPSKVVQASVSSWTNASKQWIRTSTSTSASANKLYAQFS